MLRRVRSRVSMRSLKSSALGPEGFSSTASAPASSARMAVAEAWWSTLALRITTGRAYCSRMRSVAS